MTRLADGWLRLGHHLWNCDEFVFFIFVVCDQMIGGDHCLGAVGAHLLVTAIVEKDYVAAANLAGHFSLDYGGWRRVPVVAGDVPHDWFEAEFAGDAEHGGTASAEGRAEEIGVFADGILQCGSAGGEFTSDF